jgi:hypothetical protein
MGIPGCHAEILVSEQLPDNMEIGAVHSELAGIGVSQVVDGEVLDPGLFAGANECDLHLLRRPSQEKLLARFVRFRLKIGDHLVRELIQVCKSWLPVLRHREQDPSAFDVDILPADRHQSNDVFSSNYGDWSCHWSKGPSSTAGSRAGTSGIFQPHGFCAVFGVPTHLVTNIGTEATGVLGSEASQLYEQLGNVEFAGGPPTSALQEITSDHLINFLLFADRDLSGFKNRFKF